MTTAKKTTAARQGFKTGEAIVYPAHGVGRITRPGTYLAAGRPEGARQALFNR
jgi:hypothetical protein